MKRLSVLPALVLSLSVTAPAADAAARVPQAQAGEPETRALTPKDVARLQSVAEVAMRPDGSVIAYTLSVPRTLGEDENGPAWTRLHMVSSEGGDDRTYVGGEINVSHLRWSPDGRFLAYLARRSGDDHVSIYLIPAEAGESVRLYQHETSIQAFDWRPDGRAIAFIASEAVPEEIGELRAKGFDQEIYEEDWQPRRLHVLDLPDGPGAEAGATTMIEVPGQPWHVVWDPQGKRLLTDVSPTPLIDDRYMLRRLHVIDVESGTVLTKIENPGKLGAFAFSPDGRTIALISGIDINDPREGRLLVVPAEGGELRDVLPELEGHVEAFAFAAADRIVYLASLGVGSRIARVRTNGRADGVYYDRVETVFTGLSLDRRGRSLGLVGQSPSHPTEVFALRSDREGLPQRLTTEWRSRGCSSTRWSRWRVGGCPRSWSCTADRNRTTETGG
jgi:dipeptidyl aminopeptidase/acylaminoacyl peptidase